MAAGVRKSCRECFPMAGTGGNDAGVFLQIIQATDHNQVAALLSGTRTEVDDGVSGLNGIDIVLDHHHGVTAISQRQQRIEQNAVIPRVKANRWFIKNITNAGKIRTQKGCQAHPLGFAA